MNWLFFLSVGLLTAVFILVWRRITVHRREEEQEREALRARARKG